VSAVLVGGCFLDQHKPDADAENLFLFIAGCGKGKAGAA
jgi:hypothetical protein